MSAGARGVSVLRGALRSASQNRPAAWAATAGALVMFPLAFTYQAPEIATSQVSEYAHLGEVLLHGGACLREVSFRMPLLSIVAALASNHNPLALDLSVTLALLCLGVSLIVLCRLLAPASAWAGAVALGLLVMTGAGSNGMVYPDILLGAALLLAAGALVLRARKPSLTASVVLALALGACLLARSTLALFPPILAAYEWFIMNRGSWRACWRHLLIVCLLPYLFLAPWVWMNWTLHHAFVPFEHRAVKMNIVKGACEAASVGAHDHETFMKLCAEQENTQDLGWVIRNILRHPLRYGETLARRFIQALGYQPLLIFLAVASIWLYRRREEFRQAGLLALYFVMIHCQLSMQERYLYPLWLVLAALAATPVARLDRAPEERTGDRWPEALFRSGLVMALVVCAFVSWKSASYRRCQSHQGGTAPDGATWSRHAEARLSAERGYDDLRRGLYAEAIADLRRAALYDPSDLFASLHWAWAWLLVGRPEPLLRWNQGYLTGGGWFDDQLAQVSGLMRARAYYRLGRARDAQSQLEYVTSLEASLASDPCHADRCSPSEAARKRYSWLATAALGYATAGKGRERLDYLAELLRMAPENLDIRMAQCEVALEEGEPGAALRSLAMVEKAVAQDDEVRKRSDFSPGVGRSFRLEQVYRGLIAAHRAKGARRRVLQLALGACARWPDNWGFQCEAAAAAAEAGEPVLARRYLALAKAGAGTDERRRIVADLSSKCGDYRQSRAILETLLAKSPGDVGLWLARFDDALTLGNLAEAQELLVRAEGLARGEAESKRVVMAYREMAMLHRKLGDRARAQRELAELLRRRPKEFVLWIDLADVQSDRAELAGARAALRRAEGLARTEAQRREVRRVYARFGE